MANTPEFKPLFNRVQQSDRHDDSLAVIASLGATTLESIRSQAEVFGLPQKGPYYPYITHELLASLLMSRGLVGKGEGEEDTVRDDSAALAEYAESLLQARRYLEGLGVDLDAVIEAMDRHQLG